MSNMVYDLLKYGAIAVAVPATLYIGLLGLLTTTWFQTHAVYLHAIQMTWSKDLNIPEQFGFLRNQVTPFSLRSEDSIELYCWHILPTELYREHEQELLSERPGFVSETDVTSRLPFKLLRDDTEARLIIHFHGAGGTVGSGYRVPNYRALSAGQPDKVHVLTFDYRGFGNVPGAPTEAGLIADATTVVEWALNVAKIPPSRILMFSQSLGTAVNIAIADHFAHKSVIFAGHILVAPFVDVPTLVSTYSVAGTIPLLGPLARFPRLFQYLQSFIRDRWATKDRIATYVRLNEEQGNDYRLTIIHAEDDWDIPWHHTPTVFWHAISATLKEDISFDELEGKKSKLRTDLGAAGSVVDWKTEHGVIREEILKYGLHDVIMGNPIVTMAVLRIFDGEA